MEHKLNYYLSLPYTVTVQQDETDGSWFAKINELPGCMTCAETKDQVLIEIEDAKEAWINVALEIGKEIPIPCGWSHGYSVRFLNNDFGNALGLDLSAGCEPCAA